MAIQKLPQEAKYKKLLERAAYPGRTVYVKIRFSQNYNEKNLKVVYAEIENDRNFNKRYLKIEGLSSSSNAKNIKIDFVDNCPESVQWGDVAEVFNLNFEDYYNLLVDEKPDSNKIPEALKDISISEFNQKYKIKEKNNQQAEVPKTPTRMTKKVTSQTPQKDFGSISFANQEIPVQASQEITPPHTPEKKAKETKVVQTDFGSVSRHSDDEYWKNVGEFNGVVGEPREFIDAAHTDNKEYPVAIAPGIKVNYSSQLMKQFIAKERNGLSDAEYVNELMNDEEIIEKEEDGSITFSFDFLKQIYGTQPFFNDVPLSELLKQNELNDKYFKNISNRINSDSKSKRNIATKAIIRLFNNAGISNNNFIVCSLMSAIQTVERSRKSRKKNNDKDKDIALSHIQPAAIKRSSLGVQSTNPNLLNPDLDVETKEEMRNEQKNAKHLITLKTKENPDGSVSVLLESKKQNYYLADDQFPVLENVPYSVVVNETLNFELKDGGTSIGITPKKCSIDIPFDQGKERVYNSTIGRYEDNDRVLNPETLSKVFELTSKNYDIILMSSKPNSSQIKEDQIVVCQDEKSGNFFYMMKGFKELKRFNFTEKDKKFEELLKSYFPLGIDINCGKAPEELSDYKDQYFFDVEDSEMLSVSYCNSKTENQLSLDVSRDEFKNILNKNKANRDPNPGKLYFSSINITGLEGENKINALTKSRRIMPRVVKIINGNIERFMLFGCNDNGNIDARNLTDVEVSLFKASVSISNGIHSIDVSRYNNYAHLYPLISEYHKHVDCEPNEVVYLSKNEAKQLFSEESLKNFTFPASKTLNAKDQTENLLISAMLNVVSTNGHTASSDGNVELFADTVEQKKSFTETCIKTPKGRETLQKMVGATDLPPNNSTGLGVYLYRNHYYSEEDRDALELKYCNGPQKPKSYDYDHPSQNVKGPDDKKWENYYFGENYGNKWVEFKKSANKKMDEIDAGIEKISESFSKEKKESAKPKNQEDLMQMGNQLDNDLINFEKIMRESRKIIKELWNGIKNSEAAAAVSAALQSAANKVNSIRFLS